MKINYKPNQKLFLAFLLIHTESDNIYPEGNIFIQEFLKIFKNEYLEFQKRILNIKLDQSEKIRLVNDLLGESLEYLKKEDLVKFEELLNSAELNYLFKKYQMKVEKYLNPEIAGQSLLKIENLFDGRDNRPIQIYINLLGELGQGTNYYDNRIISLSLDNQGRLPARTLRHEYLHMLIKDLLLSFGFPNISIPVGEDYLLDEARVRFDENFVLALNLFFDEESLSKGTLKYLVDQGFTKLPIFYNFLKNNVFEQKQKITLELVNELIKLL